MTPKEYLQQIDVLQSRIENLKQRQSELKAMITATGGMAYDVDKVVTSKAQSTMEERIIRAIDLENKINEEIAELTELKDKIVHQINQLTNPDHIRLLYLRYVELEKWEDIAETMNLTERRIYQIHGYALMEFERLHGISVL